MLLNKITEETGESSLGKCEEITEIFCPACGSTHLNKNSSVHNGKPKQQYKNCGRQFINNPNRTTISAETKQLIDRLLLERISLRGIARVTQVSWSWLQDYVNQKFACVPCYIEISGKLPGKLTIECDEMWYECR